MGPTTKTVEYVPAINPTIIGSVNSLTDGTPSAYRQATAINVENAVYIVRVSVCVTLTSTRSVAVGRLRIFSFSRMRSNRTIFAFIE
jgi:hypothetical protein